MSRMAMTPIRSMAPGEVTIELLKLCGEAGAFERRMLLVSFCGNDRGTADPTASLAELEKMVSAAPEEERRVQLYIARRWIALGQRQYGRHDPQTDHRDMRVEAVEESCDGLFYAIAGTFRAGQSDEVFLKMWQKIARFGVEDAIRREAV